MTRSILITGATGGLGLQLVAAARARGHDVLATGRSVSARPRIEATGARFEPADLRSADLRALCARRDSVIHAAALSASWGAKSDFDTINVDATAALLEAARSEACGRFVFVSSPSIFADFRDRLLIRAGDAPSSPPLNHYARTKLAAERMVLGASSNDLKTAAVRPRAIVGPDDQVLLPRLTELVSRRWIPFFRAGQAKIEFTDVRDAAEAILCAEDRIDAIAGRAVNVSGETGVSVREAAQALAEALGQTPAVVNLPLPLARFLAGLLEILARATGERGEPRLTRYTLATLAFSQTFDMAETAALVGFRPRHDGLAALLAAARRLKP